jgi:hypothetical protein
MNILLAENRKSSQHFLDVGDEFLFQKCKDNCSLANNLMRTAFISSFYLKKQQDLNGENVMYL